MKNYCCKRPLPESLKDPYALWDSFPCPPQGSKHILFNVDWSNKLGPKHGLKIMFRLAKRCNVEVPDMYQHPGQLGSSMILIACEADCLTAISLFCCVLLLVVLGVIIFIVLRKDQNIPNKYGLSKSKNGLLAEKQSRDQISLTCDKKWVQIFVRKRKDKMAIENENYHSNDFYQERKTGIKAHSYHKFPWDLDQPWDRSMSTSDKNHFHIYEEIDDLQSMQMEQTLTKTMHRNKEDDNFEPHVHPWDMQTIESSNKSVISDIQELSEDESITYQKYYHTYDRLHSLPPGSSDSKTGNDNSNNGCDVSKHGTMGNKFQDKWFSSLNKNHIKQKHATIHRKDSTVSNKSNEKPVCIDYVETPIIFCV